MQLFKLQLEPRLEPGPEPELGLASSVELAAKPASVPASVLASVLASALAFNSASGYEEPLGTAATATSFTAAEASSCNRDLLAQSP